MHRLEQVMIDDGECTINNTSLCQWGPGGQEGWLAALCSNQGINSFLDKYNVLITIEMSK